MVMAQKQKYIPMEQIESPEINPHTYGYLIFDKARIYNGAKITSSTFW